MQNNSPNQNLFSDLPVIHKLLAVYKQWQDFLPDFPKTSRYTLGARIDNSFIQVAELVFSACYLKVEQKIIAIEKASAKLDLLKFFLRMAWEIKAIDNKKYIVLSEQLDEIGKMLGGWTRQLKTKLPHLAEE